MPPSHELSYPEPKYGHLWAKVGDCSFLFPQGVPCPVLNTDAHTVVVLLNLAPNMPPSGNDVSCFGIPVARNKNVEEEASNAEI